MGDASHHFYIYRRGSQLSVYEGRFKDSKSKQKKTDELADKLGFVQTFLCPICFLFFLFSSSASLFYMTATALNKSAMLQITVWRELDVWRNEFDNFLKSVNTSLPT